MIVLRKNYNRLKRLFVRCKFLKNNKISRLEDNNRALREILSEKNEAIHELITQKGECISEIVRIKLELREITKKYETLKNDFFMSNFFARVESKKMLADILKKDNR